MPSPNITKIEALKVDRLSLTFPAHQRMAYARLVLDLGYTVTDQGPRILGLLPEKDTQGWLVAEKITAREDLTAKLDGCVRKDLLDEAELFVLD